MEGLRGLGEDFILNLMRSHWRVVAKEESDVTYIFKEAFWLLYSRARRVSRNVVKALQQSRIRRDENWSVYTMLQKRDHSFS